MNPEFADHPVRPGFVVVDAVQNRRVPFAADGPVERTPAATDEFRFPVSTAVAVDASRLSLPYRTGGFVRTADGEMLVEMDHRTDSSFPAGSYLVEIDAPVKVYLLVDGAFRVETTGDGTQFRFDDAAVRVGARSYHERPAGTITVTDDPRDVMDAVSLLGSSLKDLSPERSFPTLRGHPPLIEFGDAFSVPDGVERPETGVTIELPPEPEYLLSVASLAFYLGADLEPADRARLTTDAGFSYDLEPARGFQSEVARVLEQVFTLDCVTRTEGLYPIDLHERDLVEERADLGLDFADLYDRSIAEQLGAYLALDYDDAVADAVPNWCLAVDCRPELRHADYLPFVVSDLGVVRTQTSEAVESHPEMSQEVEAFTRGAGEPAVGTRSGSDDSPRSVVEDASFVELPDADAINHAWIGEEWPHNADKLLKAGFENGLARYDDEEAGGHIDVTVVCNDDRMREEYEGEQLYGDRDELEFEVETHTNTTVAELRGLLERESDFFHYIGHVEDYEFVCEDGGLDVRGLESAGPRLFLLNGCTSFEQGRQLVEAGSIAGIVTLNDVGNESAVKVGKRIARLLNQGFPVGTVITITQNYSLLSHQYLTIGNVAAGFIPPENNFQTVNILDSNPSDTFSLTVLSYPSSTSSPGGFVSPFLDSVEYYALVPGQFPTVHDLSRDAVRELLDKVAKPLIYDDEFCWPFDVGL
jgi:hypothetical protein